MGIFRRRDTETPTEVTPEVSDVLLKALLSGETITREKALTLPAISGAVDYISNSIASMPVKLYKLKQGKVEEVEDPRTRMLNGDTGDTLDGFQLKKAMVEDYLMGKGGYCYIRRSRNDVTGLFYVAEQNISVMKSYEPIYKHYKLCVMGETYRPYDFIKILRNTKDGASGVGLTEEVSKALEVAYHTLLYQLSLVKSGGGKKGFLKSQRKLGQDEINILKAAWRNLYANGTENVVVLNNGLDFQEASSSSTEMQLNESKRTLHDEIDGLFHIYPNDFDRTFKEAIYPIVKAFETALNRDLLLEKEKKNYYFEFDVKEIIRASLSERYAAYRVAKETGFMTLNEIRRAENLNWIDGMDVINVGLGAVLYDINTGRYYTPNTDTVSSPNDGMVEEEVPEEVPQEIPIVLPVEQRATTAVDFDETIAKKGKVDDAVVEKIKALQGDNKVVLWSARTGESLEQAIEMCREKGLVFDDVLSGKPNVDLFIDDKAINASELRFNPNHNAKNGQFTSGGSGGGVASSRIKDLEDQLANAKGLLAKAKIKTQIEMEKNGFKGTAEEWNELKRKEHEDAVKTSLAKQEEEKAKEEAKAKAVQDQLEYELKTQPKEKIEQYQIIQATNPMNDDYHTGIRKPSDIKTWAEVVDDEDSFVWGDFSREDAKKALKSGKITIYSSYPIEQGVFVSTSKAQSQEYAGGAGKKVYSKTIPLEDVAWISGDEGQFAKRG